MSDANYPDALPPQYTLHWYVIEQVLGQGGFGITYLARDTNLDQRVAIKEYLPVDVATRKADATVRPRTGEQSERYRWGLDRFIREARTLARFDHPSIVRVHSVFEFNNTAYMVMRFEEGENLAALLDRRRTLPEAELTRIVLPILDGLALVHAAGFIHRDIKPDNIHLRVDGTPVLLDFGSARHALGHARTVTILVAPGYAPFEQYYSTGENQGPWTDIYGLGATCYRAIAGAPPMDAISRSKGILGSTREMLVPASNVGSGRYSAQFLRAVDHALEFAEKDRPQSVAEWRAELAAGEGASAVPTLAAAAAAPAAVGSVTGVPAASPAAERSAQPVPQAVRRPTGGFPASDTFGLKRVVPWAIAGALVAAVTVIAWLWPAGDRQRIEELERRIEQLRAKDEESAVRAEAERRRADEEDQRLAEAKSQQEETVRRQEDLRGKEEEASRQQAHSPEEESRTRAELERKRLEEERLRTVAEQKKAKPAAAPGAPAASPPKRESKPAAVAETARVAPAASRPAAPPRAAAALRPPETVPSAGAPAEIATRPAAAVAPESASGPVAPPGVAQASPAPGAAPGPAVSASPPAPRQSVAAGATKPLAAPKDDAEAFDLYRKDALGGDTEAQLKVGEMYETGQGVTQNNFQAYVWYGTAARGGNAAARPKLEQVAKKLQPAERQQADRLVERLARPPTR